MSVNKEINGKAGKVKGDRTKKTKIVNILIPVVVILILDFTYLYRIAPGNTGIKESEYFNETQVENAIKNTIDLIDDENYAALRDSADEEMKSVVTKETMEEVKVQISENWGPRQSFGKIYMTEVVQENEHYAVGEVTVSYENVNVTYRLAYDQEMQLTGLYMK